MTEGARWSHDEALHRELDDNRVLVFTEGRVRTKHADMEFPGGMIKTAALFHLCEGKVTRVVNYFDREHALAELGLRE